MSIGFGYYYLVTSDRNRYNYDCLYAALTHPQRGDCMTDKEIKEAVAALDVDEDERSINIPEVGMVWCGMVWYGFEFLIISKFIKY